MTGRDSVVGVVRSSSRTIPQLPPLGVDDWARVSRTKGPRGLYELLSFIQPRNSYVSEYICTEMSASCRVLTENLMIFASGRLQTREDI